MKFGNLWDPFACDVVLLASLNSVLQLVLGQFADNDEVAGMRISTSEAMALSWKRVECLLWVEELVPQGEDLSEFLLVVYD